MDQNERLIERLDQGRRALQGMMVGLDRSMEICPGWTIKEVLAHIAGWDEVATDALQAHAAGGIPAPLDPPGIDDCNEAVVRRCEALSYEEVLQYWRQARRDLKNTLMDMPAEKLDEQLLYPWGERGNAARIVAILAEHEKEHAEEIREISRGSMGED
jgi:ribosome modulation factor